MRFPVAALAPVLDAEVVGGGADADTDAGTDAGAVVVDGATQDSRAVAAGMLFVPIVAERDGHDFVGAAVAAGAAAYLTSRPPQREVPAPALVVDDTERALRALGVHARGRLDGPVVAVTGSVGKTSTKDLCAVAFGAHWRTHASTRSFNNEIGVPLTLCNAPDGTEVAVVEMGARGIGHIALLCTIATPTIGIVTAVGAAHLELFGDLDGVARGKGELVESLPADGLAVLNADDPRVLAMRDRTRAAVLTFGAQGDVRARDVVLDAELRPRFVVETPWGSATVELGARGAHNVANALAAIGAAVHAGAPLEAVAESLAAPVLSPWRMDVQRTPDGAVVINDAYNANPDSMRAALAALAAVPARRRVAVLGRMAELGDGGAEAHRAVAAQADSLGIEVLAVGTSDYGTAPVADVDAALQELASRRLGPDDAILVKASRVAGLERVAAALLGRGRA